MEKRRPAPAVVVDEQITARDNELPAAPVETQGPRGGLMFLLPETEEPDGGELLHPSVLG